MFRVDRTEAPYPAIVLHDETTASRAEVAPWRGGLLTRFEVAGAPILFLDEASLLDTTKNVRGGAPVLFPSPGKLEGDAWSRDGRAGLMKQHGFARNLAWDVASTSVDDGASATLRLASNDATLAQYPWAFEAEMTFRLRGAAVRIEQRFTNKGAAGMPFGAGFHPYFVVPDKAGAHVPTAARAAFDNVTKRDVELPNGAIDLTAKEVDLHLHGHGGASARLRRAGLPTIAIDASPEFQRWVIWTLEGKDFVCLEPWTCPGNALNTGDDLIVLAPGEGRSLWIEISVDRLER